MIGRWDWTHVKWDEMGWNGMNCVCFKWPPIQQYYWTILDVVSFARRCFMCFVPASFPLALRHFIWLGYNYSLSYPIIATISPMIVHCYRNHGMEWWSCSNHYPYTFPYWDMIQPLRIITIVDWSSIIAGYIYIYMWVNYDDLTVTSLESWLVRGIVPKWPYFRLVNYYNLPRYIYIYTTWLI